MAQAKKGGHRITVNFADSTYEALQELAQKRGKSMAEILRDVIALGKYVEDTRGEGGHILVERGGTTREVVPL